MSKLLINEYPLQVLPTLAKFAPNGRKDILMQKLNDQQNDKLIELLQLKKVDLETELKTIMEKRIPIWRNIDQSDMVSRIDQVLEGLSFYQNEEDDFE